MTTFDAAKFQTRADLEKEIGRVFGLSVDVKPKAEIVGTLIDLRRLKLSPKNIVWGISVRATDATKKKKASEPSFVKPDRGERKPSSLNGIIVS